MSLKKNKKKVSFFVRKPFNLGNFSLENYYIQLTKALGQEFDIKIHVLPYHSKGVLRRFINCLYALVNQSEVNHVFGDIHYITIFLKKEKTILTILDCISYNSSKGIKRVIFKWFWFKLPIRNSKFITTISRSVENELIEKFNLRNKKISVIYFSIFASDITKKTKNKNSSDEFKILQIGTAKNKNIKNLALALKDLKNIALTVLGKLNADDKEILINAQINFTEIGSPLQNIQVYDLYQKHDLISFISNYEGFGLPILEANYFKKPLITSNVFSMPEIAGDSGFFVNPENISEIRSTIEKIRNKSVDIKSKIRNGEKNLLRFKFSNQVDQYTLLYKSI